MQLEMTDLGDTSKVSLQGRLDTPGVGQIETRFVASIVPAGRNAVVDLSQVTFISSMGIRLLLSTSRALGLKKAKMVLFGVQPLVRESFDTVCLSDIIPIAADEAQALGLLKPA